MNNAITRVTSPAQTHADESTQGYWPEGETTGQMQEESSAGSCSTVRLFPSTVKEKGQGQGERVKPRLAAGNK